MLLLIFLVALLTGLCSMLHVLCNSRAVLANLPKYLFMYFAFGLCTGAFAGTGWLAAIATLAVLGVTLRNLVVEWMLLH